MTEKVIQMILFNKPPREYLHAPRTTEIDPPTPSSSSTQGEKRAASDPLERAVFECLSTISVKKPENPDIEFFKSTLPNMAAFSDLQKSESKLVITKTRRVIWSPTQTIRTGYTK